MSESMPTSLHVVDGCVAWAQSFLAFLVVFSTQGYFNSFGVYQTYYAIQLDPISPSTISWIGSMQVFLVFFLGSFAGWASDRGFFYAVFLTGFVVQLTGIFAASFAKSFWQIFLSHGVCVGLGSGLMFSPTLAILNYHFRQRRSIAITVATCGGATGGTLFPVLAKELIPRLGLPWAIRIAGCIMATLLGTAAIFLRPKSEQKKKNVSWKLASLGHFHYAAFAVSSFFCFWALYFGYYYMSSYAKDNIRMGYKESFNLVVLLNAAGIPARIALGIIADCYTSPMTVHLAALCLGIAVYLAWIHVNDTKSMYLITSFFGVVAGAIQTLFLAASSSFAKDKDTAGIRVGILCTVVSFGALTGPPTGGAIIRMDEGKYLYAQIWAGLSMTISFVGLLIATVRRKSTGHT